MRIQPGSPPRRLRLSASTLPASYIPKHLADNILTSKSVLEGERKLVTVLFADLRGSMELLADRDPEEARQLLDPVLEHMMAAVHRYEGTVNQVMGDGIMALFGAPVAHEDHAVRGCYAAIDLQGAIRRYAEEIRRSHGVVLQVRVGLNAGEVVVRAIGSDLRMDYTAVGQTTHLAARMEQLAKPDTTLLTADVLRLAERFVAVAPLGPVPVKGLEAPVEVYELTGAGPRRSRLHAAAARGLTRFVGRAGELDQLPEALGRAGHGQGQIVAIVGEPGVGKSGLVWEVTHSHRIHGWLVLQAGSVSYGKATAYLPVIDLLKGYFAIGDRDGLRAVREKLTGKLLTLDRALEGSLPALLSLLDVPSDDSQWAALDPAQRRRRTLDAVKRLLLRESQVQPLLVVFEDLHWIDSETQALLDALVESLPAVRVLLLVNYRPEYRHPWGSRSYYTQLRLDPLPHDHAAELLGGLVGPDAALDPLKRVLIARTEGNPFFLEESVRSLVEAGSLTGVRGAYRLARPLPAIQVPATVQAVLAARIDRLLPADRAVLQTASVIGKDVPLTLLQAIAESDETELSAAIGRLQAAEFLYETRIFPDVEYTFKHALTHDVTYGGLLQDRRRRLHGRIVEAIERRYTDRLGEHVERLAHHAFRAEEWEKAVGYQQQAGAEALARSANLEAAAHLERSLEALRHLPESAGTLEAAFDLRVELWNAISPLGQFARATDVVRDAEGAAERLGDRRRLGRVWGLMGNTLWAVGRRAESEAISERARVEGEAIEDLITQISANTNLALTAYAAGDYRRAQAFQETILRLIPSDRVRERFGRALLPAVNALSNLARAQAQRGLFDEAVRHGEAAIALAEEAGHPYSLAIACWNVGRAHTLRGDPAPARPLLRQAHSIAEELTIGFLTPGVALDLSALHVLEGRAGDSRALLWETTAAIEKVGYLEVRAALRMGEALLAAGRVDEACVAATRALDLARERREQGHEAWSLRLLGEIAAQPRCEDCGRGLEQACPACGAGVPPGRKFCGACGQSLPSGRGAAPVTAPATYTPRHLAEKILTSRGALEGERKQVTVLFADLKGSMELLADRDPEEARKLLDPVLERMMGAVHRYEGTVNQVMGDGIMALFGAPVAHEDHAVRACYAALDMQAAMRRYAEEARRAHGVSLEIRVGLNSGAVVVRAIGSDLHMDYTAVGQTTHLAARMEQLATGGRSLLTADTLRLAEGYVEVTPLGPVPVKGLDAPVEVYELVGTGARRSRLSAAATRGLTRFVGRDAELDQLRQALGRAAAGHGQVVAIVGEPGVGKSRLVWEVTHSHRVHGWLVLQAGSVSYGKATSYLPVVELLKGYFAIEDRDGPRAVREKLTGKLLTLDRALESSLPALLALLDVPTGDPSWDRLDPRQRRQRTLHALKQLLIRESQVQPLLVVFEDLHWIDSETQALLDALVESLPATRLLLLVNYRPEYQHRWGSRTYYTQLRLDPLPPESAEELLGALLGPDAGLGPLKRMLIERTEGNPFFLEESVRTLVETEALSGERGAYRLARPLPAIQVPDTVQAILAARIDRLAPEDKALLQTASAIGKDVPFVLLQATAGLAEEELRGAIGRLQAAEFLYETSIFPDLGHTFKHALTHEVAYGSLLQDRRRRLHGEIADAIERLYPDRLGEHVDRLGHHAFRADRWEPAAVYLRQAGHKALSRSAFREAVAAYENALAAVEHLPETRERQELVIDLRLDVRHPLQALQQVRRLLEGDRAAEAIALALGDERRLGRVSSGLANTLWITGDHGAAIAAAERALDIGARLGDEAIHASAIVRLGAFHYTTGEYDSAIAYLRQGAELTGGERRGERLGHVGLASVIARFWFARTLTELGEFSEALTVAREGMDINLSTDVVATLPAAHSAVGFVHLRRGELAEALLPLTRAVEVGEAAEIRNWESQSVGLLGLQHALSGHPAEGVALLARATGLAEERGERFSLAILETWLGEAYLAAGDLERASSHAEASLEMARTQLQRGTEAWAWHLIGEIVAATDPPDFAEAETAYREALARASNLRMRPLAAHCHFGLGTLYRRVGDRARAGEHLALAATMYREMDMRLWLERAEAEMR